ncbi:MAG: tetratricopeptide repeat protein [Desulfobacteraceae bacterium]|nr:tetratricopeptide repeat protein [Desulfobacteraceae bacterium]
MNSRITLKDALKTRTLDQDKIITPEETVKRFKERSQRIDLKILKKTERIDNGRLDIPVFFSECGSDAKDVIGTNKQMGKGANPAQSEASAVMELAERFSFFSYKNDPANFVADTYKNVKADAIPFETILRSVHDQGGDEDAKRKIFEELPLQWTKGFNLTRDKEVLIPFDWFYMINEFNGPAAGNCIEEAICQGLSELVERHTSALVSQGRLSVPAIDPDSATDPVVKEMVAKYRRAGIRLHISDFTLGMGIPTIGVMAYDPDTFPVMSEIVWTAGTAPNPEKALSRALTETAQLSGDFNTGSNYVASGLPKFATLEEASFITGRNNMIPISDLPNLADNNIRVEVENYVAALAQKDMDVLLINTMHPGLKIPAFYTILPGAHFRERAAEASLGMFAARLITENFDPREASARLEHMESLLPGQYYTRFYQGLSQLSQGDPRTAKDHLEAALSLDPATLNIPDICSYLGVCHKEMEDYDRALAVLEQGEAIDAQRTDIHNLKGFCHFKMKNHEQAVASFKRVIELDPSSGIDYANVATNLRDLGRREEAIHYYEEALTIDPALDFARENLQLLKEA